jgi:hypothetical protein
MSRHLKRQAEDRSLRWGQERGRLFLALRNASIPEKVQAYKQLEKRLLREACSAAEARELRRRIAEDLLMATSAGPWRGFSPYLRRLERLGYSSMDRRLLVCVLAAQASKGSPAGVRKTAELIADIERRTRGRKFHSALWDEINGALARARDFAGLHTAKPAPSTAPRPRPTPAAARRRRGRAAPSSPRR